MNQYGVKILPKRYEGKHADDIRQKQHARIRELARSTGSQANHRARRAETQEQFYARIVNQSAHRSSKARRSSEARRRKALHGKV